MGKPTKKSAGKENAMKSNISKDSAVKKHNIKVTENPPGKQRIRTKSVLKWSNDENIKLLEFVRGNLDSFEKPNARKFYEKCVKENPELSKFQPESIRQKMKNFRASYTKANDWRNSTGAGLLEDDSEQSIQDHLNKICAFWEYLDEIFSSKKSLHPVALYESGQRSPKSEMNDSEYVDDVDWSFVTEENDTSFDVTNSNEPMDYEVLSPSQNHSDEKDSQLAKRLQKKPRANQNNSSAVLLEISKMRNETTEKKLALEEKKLALEEKRIERDYEIRKIEADARKIEAENVRLQLMQHFSAAGKQQGNDNTS